MVRVQYRLRKVEDSHQVTKQRVNIACALARGNLHTCNSIQFAATCCFVSFSFVPSIKDFLSSVRKVHYNGHAKGGGVHPSFFTLSDSLECLWNLSCQSKRKMRTANSEHSVSPGTRKCKFRFFASTLFRIDSKGCSPLVFCFLHAWQTIRNFAHAYITTQHIRPFFLCTRKCWWGSIGNQD